MSWKKNPPVQHSNKTTYVNEVMSKFEQTIKVLKQDAGWMSVPKFSSFGNDMREQIPR